MATADVSRETSAAATATGGRTWSDASGIHHERADGSRISLIPPLISSVSLGPWQGRLQEHPDEDPYLVYQDDAFSGLIWLPRSAATGDLRFGAPENAPPPAAPVDAGQTLDPQEIALALRDRVPLPDITLGMNPALGLVALPGWFWVEGYDGRPFGASRSVIIPPVAGPDVPLELVPAGDPRRLGSVLTIEVIIAPGRYEWHFGDGATLVSRSLGKPYPAESDIQHTYQYSSLGAADGFLVRLIVEFSAHYRINGGALQVLPPIRREYQASYRVQELQPVLTGR